jgi:hypothetical protein
LTLARGGRIESSGEREEEEGNEMWFTTFHTPKSIDIVVSRCGLGFTAKFYEG